MYVSLHITDAAAVLQGIPLVSAMSFTYLQLACVSAVTQGGRRINNLFNNRVQDLADNFRTGGQDRNCNTKKATKLRVLWLQAHAQNLLSGWRGFGTVVTSMVYENLLNVHNFSKSLDKVHPGGRGEQAASNQAQAAARTPATPSL